MDHNEFTALIAAIPQHVEERKKQEKQFKVIDEGKQIIVHFWGEDYIFDRVSYFMFEKLWKKGILKTDKKGYLCVKDDDYGDDVHVHRWLKRKEVEELAKVLECDEGDIHVHHKNKNNKDNRLNNLEVLYKDQHAKRHGRFNTWDHYQKWIWKMKFIKRTINFK